LPELPQQKKARFIEEYSLKSEDAEVLTATRAQADYFEELVTASGDARLAANWVIGTLAGMLNKENLEISDSKVSAGQLGGLLKRITDNTISGKIAKEVFEAMWQGQGSADEIIDARGLKQITDTGEIEKIIDDIIAANPEQVEQFRAGKEKVLGFFVGQVMKASAGKANPGQVNQLLRQKLAP